jgi:selenocysteine lyase/cysteine desulfurase
MPVDVHRIGCHALCATSRKYLRGPRGVGVLWVDRDWIERLDPVILESHAAEWVEPNRYVVRPDAKRFEVWETNVAARLGFGAAVDYALALGLEHIWPRIHALATRLRERLSAIDGVTLRDTGAVRGGIVTFTVAGSSADAVKTALRAKRINVVVLRERSILLDMRERGLTEVVRASVHYYNTEAEVDRLALEVEGLSAQGGRRTRQG